MDPFKRNRNGHLVGWGQDEMNLEVCSVGKFPFGRERGTCWLWKTVWLQGQRQRKARFWWDSILTEVLLEGGTAVLTLQLAGQVPTPMHWAARAWPGQLLGLPCLSCRWGWEQTSLRSGCGDQSESLRWHLMSCLTPCILSAWKGIRRQRWNSQEWLVRTLTGVGFTDNSSGC